VLIDFDLKDLFGFISVLLEVVAIVPYIVSMLRGRTKPHAFSWLIWCILMSISFAAQIENGAGSGSWALGASIISCLIVLCMSFKRSAFSSTRTDWIFLITALSAIPLWLVVKSPVPTVLLVTTIDLLGYGPTFRKTWSSPHEELPFAWACAALKTTFAIAALDSYAFVNWFYLACLSVVNASLAALILIRQRILSYQSDYRSPKDIV
jgi:hypothetical protein